MNSGTCDEATNLKNFLVPGDLFFARLNGDLDFVPEAKRPTFRTGVLATFFRVRMVSRPWVMPVVPQIFGRWALMSSATPHCFVSA